MLAIPGSHEQYLLTIALFIFKLLTKFKWFTYSFSPFFPNASFLYPENIRNQKTVRFSDVFRGYEKGTLETNGLNKEIRLFSARI